MSIYIYHMSFVRNTFEDNELYVVVFSAWAWDSCGPNTLDTICYT